jgi:putative membrane protein
MDAPTLALVIGGYGHQMDGYAWGWMWIMGLVFMLVVAMAAVAAVVVLARGHQPERGPGPQDILAERYARGELSTEEYHERLDGLR